MRRSTIRTLGFLGFLLWSDLAYTQRYLTTFGAMTELRAPRGARSLVAGDLNGDGTVDLVARNEARLLIHFQALTGDTWRSAALPLGRRIHALATGRCNRDRSNDIVILTEDPLTLVVWLARGRDGFYRRWETPLGGQYDEVSVGDVNSDGRGDLLVYGKKELGILAYLGKGDGTFQDPVTLVPEYSVSALAIADVNKDGLHDLFVANWLSNEVLVYENFGKLTFSEPTSLKLPYEPGALTVARIDSDINEDLVIGSADRPACRLYRGNGLGSYAFEQEVAFSSRPEQIFCADVNGDGTTDVAAFCPDGKTLEIALNDGTGRLRERVTIAGGQQPASAVIFPQAPGGVAAAAVLDGALDRIRVFSAARRRSARRSGQIVFASGRRPQAVLVVDMNRDGWGDLLVADAASRDVACYLNDSVRSFSGFFPFQTSVNMSDFVHLVKRNGAHLVIGGAPDSDAIAILEIDARTYSHKTTLVPTVGRVEVLGASASGDRLRLRGIERGKGERVSWMEYDELESGRFIERDLLPGAELVAATGGSPDEGNMQEAAYVIQNRQSNGEELYVGRNGAGGHPIATFPASALADLWLADLNEDGREDIIVHRRSPENALTVFYKGEDAWSAPVTPQTRVVLSSRNRLALVDYNSDGLTDLVVENELTRTIDLLVARRGGTYLPPVRLATAEGIGGFAVGDLDNDGVPDLAVTDAVNGALRIIFLGER